MKQFICVLSCLAVATTCAAQSRIIGPSAKPDSPAIAAVFELSNATDGKPSADRLTAVLGDSTSEKFVPRLSLSGPNGGSLTIEIAKTAAIEPKRLTVDGRAGLWFESGDSRQMVYLRPDGALEWEINFDSTPQSNLLAFPIELAHLSAYFQPPLTANEIADGHERPDSVVGSHAIYDSRGGKLCHIYRPRAFDSKGSSVWCDMRIDTMLTITIPKDFLTRAAYPVRVDPTFGYTTAGASSLSLLTTRCYANRLAANRHVAGAGERVDSFRVHWKTYTGNNDTLDIALYSWNSGIQSRVDTAVWTVSASGTAQWITSGAIAQALAQGTEYTLAINHHEGGPRVSYDVGSSGDHSYDNVDNLPSTWTEDGTGAYILSAYAFYTVTSPAQSSPPTRRRRLIVASH